MKALLHTVLGALVGLLVAVAAIGPAAAQDVPAIENRYAEVNGVQLHYLAAGSGNPVILLHGYAQTSHMWRPLIVELAKTHTVIAPDLRGFGDSDKPETGYDKATMAEDIHALVASLGYDQVGVAGHDIGLMVAYAYAAQHPAEVERIALMDAFLPGVGDWTQVWLLRDLWHFHFYGETPLALVTGRERIYLEHFWNDFAADRTRSVSEADRQLYAAAYAQPGAMAAGMEVFRAFEQDAADFSRFAETKLAMPMLVLTGEKASGEFLIAQGRLVADDVEGVVIAGSGHWLIDEAPDQVIPRLVAFFPALTLPGFTLRDAEPGDAQAVAAVFSASFRLLTFLPMLHSVEEDRAFIASVIFARCRVWVAEDSGGIAGFLALEGEEVRLLHVHPDRIGQRAGSALLDAAKRSGAAALEPWCFQANTAARRFYERHGFRPIRFTSGSRNEEKMPDVRYRWARSG